MAVSHNQLAFLVLLLGASISVLNALTCPPGQALFGERCYRVYRPAENCRTDFNFTAAQDYCQANNGELASIHSQAQNDFVTALIKKEQKAAAKNGRCGCNVKRDYVYWIGLQLDHAANGLVNGASWTDNTAVNYGNPTSASFRPPFLAGTPQGSADDGSDPGAVCPLGNEKECVQVVGFGTTAGRWTDRHCDDYHTHNVSCSCDEEDDDQAHNSTVSHHREKPSSSEEDEGVDQCRLEEAHNGFVCQYCPEGWTHFQGNCYQAVSAAGGPGVQHAACSARGANVVSIHSNAENAFVADLAIDGGLTGSILIGLQLTHASNTFEQPPNSAQWSDGTPVDYANPLPGNHPRGVYPWAPANGLLYPAQPDNRPPPGNCIVMWVPPNSNPTATWDDLDCGATNTPGTVCKL